MLTLPHVNVCTYRIPNLVHVCIPLPSHVLVLTVPACFLQPHLSCFAVLYNFNYKTLLCSDFKCYPLTAVLMCPAILACVTVDVESFCVAAIVSAA